MLALLWSAALGMVLLSEMDTTDALAWLVMLLLQSTPYLAAVLMSLLAITPPQNPELSLAAQGH